MHVLRNKPQAFIAGFVAIAIFVWSCSPDSSKDTPEPSGFDKSGMLTYYADSLIIPGYSELIAEIEQLKVASDAFTDAPDVAKQLALKASFKSAYLSFERVSIYQLGPAEKALLSNFLNTFPTDTTTIKSNIAGGIYDLTSNLTISQQGFPALDYLYFAPDALQEFTSAAGISKKKYATDLIARMKFLATNVYNGWKNSYRAEFISNTRSDAGSPIAFITNQLAFELDQMKGPRIGWPYGKQSGGIQYPQNTEGYYAGISGALAIENLNNLKVAFSGNSSGKSLSDYLIALDKQQLNADVLKQFDVAINGLKAIPEPLSAALSTNKKELDAAYTEIQRLLTLMKTDVASVLGVRITYQDTDGD